MGKDGEGKGVEAVREGKRRRENCLKKNGGREEKRGGGERPHF